MTQVSALLISLRRDKGFSSEEEIWYQIIDEAKTIYTAEIWSYYNTIIA